MGTRASEGEHEGSRRMKTELLIQMDGLNKSEEHICLLAASNLPWEIDSAMLRRFEKRVLYFDGDVVNNDVLIYRIDINRSTGRACSRKYVPNVFAAF